MSPDGSVLPTLSFVVVACLVSVAAVVDLATRRIPNALFVCGTGLGLGLSIWYGGTAGALGSLAGFALGLALLTPGFALGMTGGGDVKLVAAIGSLLGARLILYAVLLYLLSGLVWALAFGIYAWKARGAAPPFVRYRAMLRTLWATGQVAYVPPRADEAMAARVPMAPAIAFGAIAAPLLFG